MCCVRSCHTCDLYRHLNINLGILLRTDCICRFAGCFLTAQYKLARALRIFDGQMGAACGRGALARIYGRYLLVARSHAERQTMSRKIDRKIGDGIAACIRRIVCKRRMFGVKAESAFRLRQYPPLVRCQCVSTRCRIRRCDRFVSIGTGSDVAALAACLERDVLMRGRGDQPLVNGEFARELVVGIALVGELLGERVQHGVLIARDTVGVGEKGHDVLCADRLVDDDVAALHRGWRRRVMRVDDGRMAAVLVDVEIRGILLVDDAVRGRRIAAVEMRDAALRCVDLIEAVLGEAARTLIFVVLIVTLVAPLVDPLCTVLQVEIRCTAVVDESVQIGLVCQQGNIQLARGQRKQIAVELHVGDVDARLGVAGLCSIIAHIHVDLALIGGEGVVAVLRPRRHLNRTAARNRDIAVLCVRRHAVAVDGHIHITAHTDRRRCYENTAFLYLREDARIVEAREDVLSVERDAPFLRVCTRDLEIAVDADGGGFACLVGLLSKAIALLDSDAVAAKPTRHGYVERSIDGDL